MKKNHLDFLKVIVFLITVSSINTIVFSFTVEDIIDKSRTDPEFAWDMYLLYISNQEFADNNQIDKLGQFLYAKRQLKNYEFALKEDIDGLIKFLKSNRANNKIKYYLLNIFSQERLFEYALEKLKITPDVLYLFDLISNYDYETFSKELLNILTDKKIASKYVQVISKLQSNETLVKSLMDHLKKQFTNTESIEEKKTYFEIYKQLLVYYPEYKDQIFEKFGKKLSSKTFSFRDFFNDFGSFLKNVFAVFIGSKQNVMILIVILLSIILLLLLLIPSVRYYIYSLLGSWRMAALVYRKIVEKDPLNEEKRLKLAQLYEKAGMYEEAMNEYNFLKRIKLE
uniref:Tetratricopeptide repeat protein n=1 Tax=Fervidobacterium nodosum TaxID=2424 RepID=A0A7C5U2S6_9BACT